jgi:hypothetical protein
VVAAQVVEQVMSLAEQYSSFHRMGKARAYIGILRMLRLMRIVRMVRLLHLYDELQILVNSIMDAMKPMLWALSLLFAMVYAFGIFLAQRIAQVKEGDLGDRLAYFYRDVPRTSLTLIEFIFSGISWDEPVMLLFDEVGWFSGILSILFLIFGLCVLVNIVTGIFIDRTIRTNETEMNDKLVEELAVAFGLIEDAFDWTHLEDDIQTLDFEEFCFKLRDPVLAECFERINIHVDLDSDRLQKFFDLLDTDGSGTVNAHELYWGCLRLRGNVQAVDLAIQTHTQQKQLESLQEMVKDLTGKLTELDEKVGPKRTASVGSMRRASVPGADVQANGRRAERPNDVQ